MNPSQVQPSAQPRILFFADASSMHTQRWLAAATARGAQAVVVTRIPAYIPGVKVITVAVGPNKMAWFTALPELRRVVKIIAQDFQPNVLHGHYVASYGFWAAACGLNLPCVLTAWGSDILLTPQKSFFMRALVRWSLRRANAITADSQDMLNAILLLHPQAPVEQILWGADTDHFCPGKAADHFEIISLRSWEANYNIDTIIDAFAKFLFLRPHSRAVLHLLGGGSLAMILQEQVNRLGLSAHVRLHGRLDDAGMLALMQRCHVSVSVPSSDATSVSMLEAMACGLPIIASQLPANQQWINQDGGWIVPVRDTDALLEALTDAHDHAAQAHAKGQRNRRLVLEKASHQQQMDMAWQVYERLLKDGA